MTELSLSEIDKLLKPNSMFERLDIPRYEPIPPPKKGTPVDYDTNHNARSITMRVQGNQSFIEQYDKAIASAGIPYDGRPNPNIATVLATFDDGCDFVTWTYKSGPTDTIVPACLVTTDHGQLPGSRIGYVPIPAKLRNEGTILRVPRCLAITGPDNHTAAGWRNGPPKSKLGQWWKPNMGGGTPFPEDFAQYATWDDIPPKMRPYIDKDTFAKMLEHGNWAYKYKVDGAVVLPGRYVVRGVMRIPQTVPLYAPVGTSSEDCRNMGIPERWADTNGFKSDVIDIRP